MTSVDDYYAAAAQQQYIDAQFTPTPREQVHRAEPVRSGNWLKIWDDASETWVWRFGPIEVSHHQQIGKVHPRAMASSDAKARAGAFSLWCTNLREAGTTVVVLLLLAVVGSAATALLVWMN